MRLNGATYEDLAQAGGGILSTVAATRDASETELVADALSRVDAFIAEGVSTIEIKSGYGLDRETELKMLRVARKIAEERDVDVITTYLGAHAVPLEYSGRENAYIDEICLPTLRIAVEEGLVDSVDAFCEGIAFQPDQVAKVFDLACELGLPIKIHAEQLSNIGGAKLAARYNALSADHLEYLDEQGAAAMASAGTVAVILPGAFYTLSETQKPPIYMLRHYSIPIAIATDANPGSSPMTSLLLAMNMVCTLFQMTPEEALIGTTRNAACALGLGDRGVVQEGYRADLAVWDIRHPSELAYRIGFNSLKSRIIGGKL
jgi:imidazolonepropionase